MACFDCGVDYDANGNVAVQFIPSCDAITNNGGTNGGMSCIIDADGKKKLFVAPDAGGRAGRQAQAISNTFLGPTVGSLTFNTGNSGNAIYHTTAGLTITNFSCARTQTNGVQLHVVLNGNASAGAKGVFKLEDSFDGATWVPRIEHAYDNTGLGARDITVGLDSEVWIAHPALASTSHFMRVVCIINSGTFIFTGGSSSNFTWNTVGMGEL